MNCEQGEKVQGNKRINLLWIDLQCFKLHLTHCAQWRQRGKCRRLSFSWWRPRCMYYQTPPHTRTNLQARDETQTDVSPKFRFCIRDTSSLQQADQHSRHMLLSLWIFPLCCAWWVRKWLCCCRMCLNATRCRCVLLYIFVFIWTLMTSADVRAERWSTSQRWSHSFEHSIHPDDGATPLFAPPSLYYTASCSIWVGVRFQSSLRNQQAWCTSTFHTNSLITLETRLEIWLCTCRPSGI